jgi:poly(3-hydroxybutyrate) depolymerase
VLLVHGTADEHVRPEGGRPKSAIGRAGERNDASLQEAVDYYVARNGLVAYPETREDGKVRTETYGKGKEGKVTQPVRVVRLEGGGHAWPGAAGKTRAQADAPFPWDASAAIVAFFSELQPVRGEGAAPVGR